MLGRVLITGVAGFAGSHLAELLVREGVEVHGVVRSAGPYPNLGSVWRDVRLHRADLLDEDQTLRAISAARPEVVFHLAAQPIPSQSWQHPRATFRTNALGTLELLEALRALGSAPLVVLASTAEVYAPAGEPALPLDERHPIGPGNPYAASKVAAEMLVAQYAAAGIVSHVILRFANQVGPRLSRDLVASAFAAQIAEAEAGGPRVVRVGNLEARRDFVDVRDAARAYVLAAEWADRLAGGPEATAHQARGAARLAAKRAEKEAGRPGEALPPARPSVEKEAGRSSVETVYNVGTGNAVPIRAVLETLLEAARVRLVVEEDPALRRKSDRPTLALDARAFRARTGWAPRVPLAQSLRDTLEHWRQVATGTVAGRAPSGSGGGERTQAERSTL